MKITLVSHTKDPEQLIERVGRVCMQSEGRIRAHTYIKFIRNRKIEHHESIFEFADACFFIEGITRTCSHQLVRHRLFSFMQVSQRYTESRVIDLPTLNYDEETLALFADSCDNSIRAYNELIAKGVKKEDARLVLPQASNTSIYVKGNFRQWRNFLKLRLDKHAQLEIRQMAHIILNQLMLIAPTVFEDLFYEAMK